MKKLIALLLAMLMIVSLIACGKKKDKGEDEPLSPEELEATIENVEGDGEETTEEPDEEVSFEDLPDADTSLDLPLVTPDGEVIDVNDLPEDSDTPIDATETLTVLKGIWDYYAEEEKFAIMGGNPEAGIMDEPGRYDLAYAENLSYNLVIPADQIGNIAEASTMIHMMNANTFTCGAFKLADGVDAAAFAAAVRDAIQGNQWICGFPETLVIAEVGGIVLVSFGVADAMTPYQTHLTEAYPDAQILYNEAIAG